MPAGVVLAHPGQAILQAVELLPHPGKFGESRLGIDARGKLGQFPRQRLGIDPLRHPSLFVRLLGRAFPQHREHQRVQGGNLFLAVPDMPEDPEVGKVGHRPAAENRRGRHQFQDLHRPAIREGDPQVAHAKDQLRVAFPHRAEIDTHHAGRELPQIGGRQRGTLPG